MQIKFTSRDDLIEALEARRPWAKTLDKAATAKHKEQERAALDAYRTRLKEQAKLTYVELKARREERAYANRVDMDFPSCPESVVTKLDRVLANLRLTGQKEFTLDESGGNWSTAHWLLTYDENAHKAVC